MLGGIFPLVTTALFERLTYPGASSLLGGVVRLSPFGAIDAWADYMLGGVTHHSAVGSGILGSSHPVPKQIRKCESTSSRLRRVIG